MLEAERRNLTYVMLFRIAVVTLLLLALLLAEWYTPDTVSSTLVTTLSRYILLVYGFTIVAALLVNRTQNLLALTIAQAAVDLLLTAGLVYLTGGADSSFVFLQLIAIVGAAAILRRFAPLLALGALLLYVGASALVWFGIVPRDFAVPPSTLAALLRTVATNSIAFVATGLLSGRLAGELGSARAVVASQREQILGLESLHSEIVASLTSGLVTIAANGEVLTANQAASDILGVAKTALINRPIAEVLPSLAPLIQRHSDGAQALRRIEVNHQGRVLGVSISPLVAQGRAHEGRVINFQDLTDYRRMEEIVARSEQLAAIGRLAAGIAHEIRNPLQAISGSIELIASLPVLSTDDGARELTDIVLRETERLNQLITELLDFARPREPQLAPLDLGHTVSEILQVMANDRSIDSTRLVLELPPGVSVHADAALFRQVLWNLVRNAAEADPQGTIEISLTTVDKPRMLAELRIRDHGPGIAAELRSRIFEPFFSTKERGTGLGLAIVHRIVEQHHGTISVEQPTEGGGTIMTIRLPRERVASAATSG